MENAAKALYMAAGVLIGIMLLSVIVFIFSSGGKIWETKDSNAETQKIEEFNSKLIIYTGDSRNTIFDVITACNLAYDINKQNEYDNINNIEIDIKGLSFDYNITNDPNLGRGKIFKGDGSQVSLTNLINETSFGNNINEIEQIDPTNPSGRQKYKYIFIGTSHINEQTGKIDKITFTCQENT